MDSKSRLYLVIVLVALVAIILGGCLGLLLGGVIGYQSGWNAGKRTQVPSQGIQTPAPTPGIERPAPMAGALVTDLVPGSPAERAGIREGDRILAVSGVSVTEQNTLSELIQQHRPGDEIELQVWSRGVTRNIRVQLTENPRNANTAFLGVYTVPATR